MHHNEPISFSDALNIVETALEYDKWMFEIPYIAFPAAWKIQVIPPIRRSGDPVLRAGQKGSNDIGIPGLLRQVQFV